MLGGKTDEPSERLGNCLELLGIARGLRIARETWGLLGNCSGAAYRPRDLGLLGGGFESD